jgi:hypothetical protein
MLDFGGLRVEELVRKLVNIGCDMSNVFQGHRTTMTMQFKDKVAPFITRMHYFAHQTNLVVITLSNVPLVHRLEGSLQNMYVFIYFSESKKVCIILEAYGSFQHQGQQDFMECQDLLNLDAFSFKKNLF